MTSAIDFLPTISSCQAVSQINRATARWGPHAGNDLLSDVLLDSLQCRNVLGHLILLGSEFFYVAPHDVEIGRQGLKLLRGLRRSCSHGWRLRRRNRQPPSQRWSLGYHHLSC